MNLTEWKNLELPPESGFSAARESIDGKFRLVDIEEIHVFQDGLDRKLEAAGLPASLIILPPSTGAKKKLILSPYTAQETLQEKQGLGGVTLKSLQSLHLLL